MQTTTRPSLDTTTSITGDTRTALEISTILQMDTETTSTSFTTGLEVTTSQEVGDTTQTRMALKQSQVKKNGTATKEEEVENATTNLDENLVKTSPMG